jgi:branched-chain amino acid transport system ATP-binding protein
MSVLEVENLAKDFGGLKVLHDVSFALEPGEKLALIGPNGAGKSTLLNVIGGQLPASGGSVTLNGKRITSLPANKRLHLGVGRSYQVNNLFFEMSIQDNVLLALYGGEKSHFHMLGSLERRKDYIGQAEELMKAVGLYEKRYDSLHVLSYGDQRLVELALAYTSKPKVVLLDEPRPSPSPTSSASSRPTAACFSARTTWTWCSISPTASWC